MIGRPDRPWRMIALLLVFVVAGGASALRLGYWQVIAASELVARSERTNPGPAEDIPPRAEILDRDGNALAKTAILDQLVAHPDLIPEHRQDETVRILGEIMDLSSAEARARYGPPISSDRKWAVLEPRLTIEQSLEVRLALGERRISGISLDPRQVRVYPEKGGVADTSLAAQLLGFVDADGRGRYGVEQVYDDRLTGREEGPQAIATMADIDLGDGTTSPFGVAPIQLTIDRGLQRQLERELAAAKVANGSPRVSGLVMDPNTGRILAWASVPSYDANRFREEVATHGLAALRDPIASDAYEPGSVMKALTATAALHHGVVTPTTPIKDSKEIEFYGHTVRNADHLSKGTMKMKDIVAWSRNVGITRVAQRLGNTKDKAAQKLYRMWERLGIVGPTGVDIAAEARGISHDPSTASWDPVDLSNRAFGQGISVTLLQLARAYATMVNGGYLVTPHAVVGSEASQVEPERVLSKKVARQMRDILIHVTGSLPWYAADTLIYGHLVGGKTGTAQYWMPEKRRLSKKRFNFSFIGFVGDDEPRALIAVRIHETRPKILGQGKIELKMTSFELFRRIAKASIKNLDIRKAKDPDTGYPVPLSRADQALTPRRFAQHKKDQKEKARQAATGGDRGRSTAKRDADERPERTARGDAGHTAGGTRAARPGR